MKPLYLLFSFLIVFYTLGCRDGKKYHDEIPAAVTLQPGDARSEALVFQKEMNEAFRDPEKSPLPDRYRMDFNGLDFFEPDSIYRVVARVERTPEAEPFLMPTTTERRSAVIRYGIAHFRLKGKNFHLELYVNRDPVADGEEQQLFIPFLDKTNGVSTYEGGRYLDLEIPKRDSLILDFNKAYNPYCAYNKKYSCPIVPRVNFLDTKIRAGVKAFKKP